VKRSWHKDDRAISTGVLLDFFIEWDASSGRGSDLPIIVWINILFLIPSLSCRVLKYHSCERYPITLVGGASDLLQSLSFSNTHDFLPLWNYQVM
jgi:hypothetical protein